MMMAKCECSLSEKGPEFKSGGTNISDNNHTGQLHTARADVSAAKVDPTFEIQQVTIQGH
jgi:hypothetical protein